MAARTAPASKRLAAADGCAHEDFHTEVRVGRVMRSDDDPTIIGFTANISISCLGCKQRFIWIGPGVGDLPSQPMVSLDRTELRAPIRPPDTDEKFGQDMMGYRLRIRGTDA